MQQLSGCKTPHLYGLDGLDYQNEKQPARPQARDGTGPALARIHIRSKSCSLTKHALGCGRKLERTEKPELHLSPGVGNQPVAALSEHSNMRNSWLLASGSVRLHHVNEFKN